MPPIPQERAIVIRSNNASDLVELSMDDILIVLIQTVNKRLAKQTSFRLFFSSSFSIPLSLFLVLAGAIGILLPVIITAGIGGTTSTSEGGRTEVVQGGTTKLCEGKSANGTNCASTTGYLIVKVNSYVTATYVMENVGTKSVQAKFGVWARRGTWDDQNFDFPDTSEFTLQPDQPYSVSRTRLFQTPGNYFATGGQTINGKSGGINGVGDVHFSVAANVKALNLLQILNR